MPDDESVLFTHWFVVERILFMYAIELLKQSFICGAREAKKLFK